MKYYSTRGGESCEDIQAVLKGIADNGGLFFSPRIAELGFDVEACLALKPLPMAAAVISALLPGFEDMPRLVSLAYSGTFETEDITPLVPLGEDWLLELLRGPTSAFKDVALSMLPRLITAARAQSGAAGDTVILTATSGDTGKAALEGFHDVEGTSIFVFYPAGGVSPIQRKQMVTQPGKNVHVCAVRGNFDDCQTAVKAAFAEISGKGLLKAKGLGVSSANSINVGRLVPQVVYYFAAYARLLERGAITFGDKLDFVVPTGNFGDILAGYIAKLMGLPVGKLICASNENRVLTDFFQTGVYDRRRSFVKTASPSMDILISSNLERLLYICSGWDTELVKRSMESLSREGVYALPDSVMANIRESFDAGCCSEAETLETIRRVWEEQRYLCDPHTAVAIKVAGEYKQRRESRNALTILATASPYKFPGAVLSALGREPGSNEFQQLRELNRLSGVPVPAGLAALETMEEQHLDEIDRADILPYILNELGV